MKKMYHAMSIKGWSHVAGAAQPESCAVIYLRYEHQGMVAVGSSALLTVHTNHSRNVDDIQLPKALYGGNASGIAAWARLRLWQGLQAMPCTYFLQ